FVLRLHRRPGERGAGGQALEDVVAGVGPGRGEADVEVEGVRVAAGGERAQRGRAEAAQRAVVERAAAVDVLVHLQVELARESRTTGARAGERVGTGKSPGVRDRDRAGDRVADLHGGGVEDRAGPRAGHGELARCEGVGRNRGRGRSEVGEG